MLQAAGRGNRSQDGHSRAYFFLKTDLGIHSADALETDLTWEDDKQTEESFMRRAWGYFMHGSTWYDKKEKELIKHLDKLIPLRCKLVTNDEDPKSPKR